MVLNVHIYFICVKSDRSSIVKQSRDRNMKYVEVYILHILFYYIFMGKMNSFCRYFFSFIARRTMTFLLEIWQRLLTEHSIYVYIRFIKYTPL